MKYVIVVDSREFNKHIRCHVTTDDNGDEVWTDVIDVDYLRSHIKTLEKKVPYGSDLFNDYVNGWNDCIDEVETLKITGNMKE